MTRMHSSKHLPTCTAQRGAILVISLLFLLVLTLIGISSMQGTTMEEKMSGNMRDRSVALQATETAARDGEAYIESVASPAAFDGTSGRFGLNNTAPNPFLAATWTSNTTSRAGTAIPGLTTPRYFVRYNGTLVNDSNSLKINTYGNSKPGDVSTFEITARGTGIAGGSTPATEAMVRTFYGRKF